MTLYIAARERVREVNREFLFYFRIPTREENYNRTVRPRFVYTYIIPTYGCIRYRFGYNNYIIHLYVGIHIIYIVLVRGRVAQRADCEKRLRLRPLAIFKFM